MTRCRASVALYLGTALLLSVGTAGAADPARPTQRAELPDRARSADAAAPSVPVRVGSHADYLRLVFDWTKAVDYRVRETRDAVVVTFSRAARIDVDALRKRLPDEVADLKASTGKDALVVSFSKRADRRVRHLTVGTKVVVDLLHDRAAARPTGTKPAPQEAKGDAPPQAEASAQPAAARQVAPAQASPQAASEPQPAQQEPPAASEPTPERAAAAQAYGAGDAAAPVAGAAPGDEAPPPASAPVPAVREEAIGSAAAEAIGSAAAEAREDAAADSAANYGEAAGTEAAGNTAVSLVFEWPEAVGAAVFRRAPYIWVVFDRRAQLNLAALRDAGSGVVSMIEQLPVGTGTVVRMIPKPGLSPRVSLEETNWIIGFQPSAISPAVPIALRIRPDAPDGMQLELPVSEFGRLIRFPDPDVGDMLTAATLRAPGHGIAGKRRYPEFTILASAQGVGVEQLSDDVEVRDTGDRGIAVSTRAGLHISPVGQNAAKGGDFLGPRIFNFTNWYGNPRESFIAARQALFRHVITVPEERRDDARLDLARFYFARGYAPEALGVLRTIEYVNPDMASQPEIRALKAAVQVHMGRPLEARKALLDPSFDQYREIALWRGSMYMQAGDMKKAAAHFRAGEAALQSYPASLRNKLAIELSEASLADLDVGSAALWLDQLGAAENKLPRSLAARLQFNQGVLARDNRKLDDAVAAWKKTKQSHDAWNVARAEYALVKLGLQQETLTEDEAIERLDRLRFQWRGDELELSVLRTLGQLYLERNEYRKGLSTLRTAVTYFPNNPKVKDIAQMMTESFRKLHLAGVADALPPLKALALYDDFRELTPAGPEGDLMIQRLADRLVAVDLLDRAASLLAHQVRYRLKGEERARVGAKLALIMLLDRNPKGALSALRNSFQPNLPYDVEDDRRRIRAKATMDLGRFEDAVALLAGDVSREADLLRANIYWSTKDYGEAAKVLQRLAGDPLEEGTYPDEQAQYVLSWAVALRLKRDEAGLQVLRELYGPGMRQSKLADAFAYISSSSSESARNIEEMSRRIAETDKFEAFLKNYRERLIPVPAKAATNGADKPDGTAKPETDPGTGTVSSPPAAAPDAGALPPPPPPPRG